VTCLKHLTEDAASPADTTVYDFGSHLRRKLYRDVDVIVVYQERDGSDALEVFEARLAAVIREQVGQPDITVGSAREFAESRLKHNNLMQVFP